jgi:hypothetical protein
MNAVSTLSEQTDSWLKVAQKAKVASRKNDFHSGWIRSDLPRRQI